MGKEGHYSFQILGFPDLTQNRNADRTEQAGLYKKFHINPAKIQSIYNWIRPEVLESRKPYDSDSKKILTVGRFSEEKGYDMLVEVARKIMPGHPDWEWHLYGTGPTWEEIREKIESYGLGKQLLLKGNVKDAWRFFYQYAFCVLPSYREGLPLVLLEAKACGLPMVSFDVVTGPNEIIRDGIDGYLIPPYDLDMMAERMEELMLDKNMRTEFSKETATDIQKFEKDKIYDQWRKTDRRVELGKAVDDGTDKSASDRSGI